MPGTAQMVDGWATLPTETAPRRIVEIWASNSLGQPRLVWVAKPDGPASATVAWIAASSVMRVTWVPLNPPRHDRYSIVRPDGTLAGTVPQGATTFDDLAARPLNGAYKVVSQLAAMSDATPTLTNSVNLTAAPGTVTANRLLIGGENRVRVAWTHPAYGRPPKYRIYRENFWLSDGPQPPTLMAEIDGSSLVWDEAHVDLMWGQSPRYRVVPTFATGESAGTSLSAPANIPPLEPGNVSVTPAIDTLWLNWSRPGGAVRTFETQRYDTTVGFWEVHANFINDPPPGMYPAGGVFRSTAWGTTHVGYMRVRSISEAGLPSDWVQAGPVAPGVPAPLFGVGPLSVQASGFARFVVTTETFDTFCAEYYWARFPEYGWRSVFLGSGSSSAPCQTGDPLNNGVVWWDFERLQNTPVYARAKRVRNGIDSVWVQFGPV